MSFKGQTKFHREATVSGELRGESNIFRHYVGKCLLR